MALIQSPFTSLPAYRPVSYTATADSPVGTVLENAVVTIYKDAVAIGPAVRFKSISNAAGPPGFITYTFAIDIQKYCQDTLGPTEELPTTIYSSTDATQNNVDLQGNYHIDVDYEQINPTTGLLEASGIATDTSTDIAVFSITRQHQQEMDLSDYIGVFGVEDLLFLTESPRILDICFEDNGFLSALDEDGPQTNAFEIELFDAAGVQLYIARAFYTSAIGGMATLNIGLNHFSTAGLTWFDVAPNFNDPLIASYSISIGRLTTFPTVYTKKSETFTYNLVGKCCGKRDLRLHWMNYLAGTDSYTFNSEKDLTIKTTSDRGEKALNWVTGSATPHSVNDIGKMKLKSEGVLSYKLKSRFLTNAKALWLSQLLTSPKVYAEIDGEFIPVIVADTEQSISRQNGFIQYEITVELANDLIIQRL